MTGALILHRADGTPVSTPFHHGALGKNDPFARQREIAWSGPAGMAVGRIGFTGEIDIERYPHIETLVVVEGELTLSVPGETPLVVGAQSGAVIGCGTALRIAASAPARFVFCTAACDQPTKQGVYAIRADANFKPSSTLPPEVLLGPAPECRSDNVFVDDCAKFSSGTWDSTPYHRIVRPHRVNEFMHLAAGSVRFASPDGTVLSTHTGDAFFVPKGSPVGWESSERVAKFYVVQA